MVDHFAQLLERSRYDVAAFGRGDEDDGASLTPEAQALLLTRAYGVIQRAEGMLEVVEDHDNRWLRELRNLVSAVSPVVRSSAKW